MSRPAICKMIGAQATIPSLNRMCQEGTAMREWHYLSRSQMASSRSSFGIMIRFPKEWPAMLNTSAGVVEL